MNFLMLGLLHTSDGLYSVAVLVKRYSKAKGWAGGWPSLLKN
jgi:hypothetical protein